MNLRVTSSPARTPARDPGRRAGRVTASGRWGPLLVLVGGVWLLFHLSVTSQAAGQTFTYPLGSHEERYRHPGPQHRDDGFVFCLLRYASDRHERDGAGWRTDFPRAGHNLTERLSEVTSVRVASWAQWVVDVGSPAIFQCPLLVTSDVGTMRLSDAEADNLRGYLEKGGILWVDDFWGPASWQQWLRELGRFIPARARLEAPTFDHLIYGVHFRIRETLQVSHLDHWRGSAGEVRERADESPETPLQVVVGPHGRVLVVMTFNTDVADPWEREADDEGYFEQFAPSAYALAANLVLYAMTH